MTHLREHWEGVCLPGDYTLEQWLGGDDSAAFFRTAPDSDGRRAVAKLIPEAQGKAAAQLELWHRTRQLRHPNLVELLDCGRAEQAGERVLYALVEAPDDTLADGLSRGPLEEREAREVLDSVIAALRYLHAQGLVVGALDPDHIVAIGERIAVSTGSLREAETAAAYGEDVRLLGELWRRALLPASGQQSENDSGHARGIAAHAADPNPETRWTLAEIIAALETVPEIVTPAQVSSAGADAAATDSAAEPPAIVPVVMEEAMKPAPVLPPPHRHPPTPVTRDRLTPQPFPRWIIVGAAGLVALILGLHWLRPSDAATAARVASVPAGVETPVAAPPPPPFPPKPAPARVSKPAPVTAREVWRVVAFTFRTREAAARKAEQLNHQHPGLNAGVFAPKNKSGYYLVSLGGRMTHEEAVRLQHSARGKGLPRDLYVQNYSE
jgi:hypothetical protein